jgi:hypothetical protein
LAIDASDRLPRLRLTIANVRATLLKQQIEGWHHAHQFGVDLYGRFRRRAAAS